MSINYMYIKVLLQTVAYCKQTVQQKEQIWDFLQKHLNLKEKAEKNCGSHRNIKLYPKLISMLELSMAIKNMDHMH